MLADVLGLGGRRRRLGGDASAIAARRWQTTVCRALELAQVPYVIVDEDVTADELAGYRAVIAPMQGRADQHAWQVLRELAEQRRTVVVIGPGTPSRDEFDAPLAGVPRRMGRLQPGSLDDLASLAADLAGLAGDIPEAWQVERPDIVRTATFCDAADVAQVVFVVAGTPALRSRRRCSPILPYGRSATR